MEQNTGPEVVSLGDEMARAKQSTSLLGRVTSVRTFRSLAYPSFRWLWAGTVSSQVGNWMQQVALGWLVLEMTNSPALLGAVGFVRSVPILLLSLAGGVTADRVDRRKLLMLTQSATASLSLLLAILISTGQVQVWEVFVITFLMGTAMAFNQPTRQALISDTVERESVVNAVSLSESAMNVTRIFGPSAAGLLIASVGVSGCYYVQAAAFAVALTCSYPIKVKGAGAAIRKVTAWHDFVEGLRYLRANPSVATLIVVESVPGFFVLPYLILMPIFARDVLKVGSEGLGMMLAIPGAGAIVGSLILASLGNYHYKGWLVLITAFITGVAAVFFALSTSFPLSLAMLIIIGGFGMNYTSITLTLILSIVPRSFQGRVVSMHSLSFSGMMPLGSAYEGALAGAIGAPLTLAIGGGIMSAFILGVAVFLPRVRRLD